MCGSAYVRVRRCGRVRGGGTLSHTTLPCAFSLLVSEQKGYFARQGGSPQGGMAEGGRGHRYLFSLEEEEEGRKKKNSRSFKCVFLFLIRGKIKCVDFEDRVCDYIYLFLILFSFVLEVRWKFRRLSVYKYIFVRLRRNFWRNSRTEEVQDYDVFHCK